MTTEYAARKNEEAYDHVFILHHPDEERPAARPLRTAPAYDRQKARGAQFGQVNGWERPIYYGPPTRPRASTTTPARFRRGGWWQYAVEEAKAIRENVGPDRRHRLHQAPREGAGRRRPSSTGSPPTSCRRSGRINLTYALTDAGTTRTEYTIVRLAEDDYYLVSRRRLDRLRRATTCARPSRTTSADFGRIEVQDVTTQWGVFALAGPDLARHPARRSSRTRTPPPRSRNKRFPWLSARGIELGMVPGQRASASPTPASSAGSCTTRSRCRTTSSTG